MGKCGKCGRIESGHQKIVLQCLCIYNMAKYRENKRSKGHKESKTAEEFFTWALKKANENPKFKDY